MFGLTPGAEALQGAAVRLNGAAELGEELGPGGAATERGAKRSDAGEINPIPYHKVIYIYIYICFFQITYMSIMMYVAWYHH